MAEIYQLYTIEKATKNQPKRMEVALEGTKAEVEARLEEMGRDVAYRDLPKGIRVKPAVETLPIDPRSGAYVLAPVSYTHLTLPTILLV